MKPGAVTTFQILGWIAVAISAAVLIGRFVEIEGEIGTFYQATGIILVFVLPFALVLGLAAATVIASTRRSAGRWLYLALAIVLLLLSVFTMFGPNGPISGIVVVMTFLQWAVLIGSIAPLFLPSTGAWYASAAYPYRDAPGGYPPPQPPNPPQPAYAPQPPYPPQPSAAHEPGLRPCPHCAEPIRAEASKCRFCGSEVEPLTA